MTRAGVVKHPRDWEHCGYHEIKKEKSKFRTIARDKLCDLIEIEHDELPKAYEKWIKQMLKQGHLSRDSIWSADFAVGDEPFVRKIFKLLGFPTRQPKQAMPYMRAWLHTEMPGGMSLNAKFIDKKLAYISISLRCKKILQNSSIHTLCAMLSALCPCDLD